MIAITSHTGLMKYDANKRFFSINRAYTPGMSRLGATMWTGDISVSWESLAQQPGYAFYADLTYARRFRNHDAAVFWQTRAQPREEGAPLRQLAKTTVL